MANVVRCFFNLLQLISNHFLFFARLACRKGLFTILDLIPAHFATFNRISVNFSVASLIEFSFNSHCPWQNSPTSFFQHFQV